MEAMPGPRPLVIEALRAISSALHTAACAGLMIDPKDLGRALGSARDGEGPPAATGGGALFNPTIFLYDHVPGGVGLAARLYEQRTELLRRARRLIEGCACEDGCPSCIGPSTGTPMGTVADGSRRAFCLEVMTQLGVVPLQ
jgi:DEAD/DEAH box helicase domain-containing protein